MQGTAELKQEGMKKGSGFHPSLQWAAKVISIVFHPLFVPVYIIQFYLHLSPTAPFLDPWDKTRLTLSSLVMYSLFPLVTILLAKALGFVQTVFLKTQKDRIIPYIACGLYYFWMWYVLRNQSVYAQELVLLSLAIFISASGGLIANSYLKVSMHAISMGVMVTYIYQLALRTDANFGIWISLAFFIAGLVSTARMINSDHNQKEIYWGLAIGIVGQIAAYWIVY